MLKEHCATFMKTFPTLHTFSLPFSFMYTFRISSKRWKQTKQHFDSNQKHPGRGWMYFCVHLHITFQSISFRSTLFHFNIFYLSLDISCKSYFWYTLSRLIYTLDDWLNKCYYIDSLYWKWAIHYDFKTNFLFNPLDCSIVSLKRPIP